MGRKSLWLGTAGNIGETGGNRSSKTYQKHDLFFLKTPIFWNCLGFNSLPSPSGTGRPGVHIPVPSHAPSPEGQVDFHQR